MDITTKSGNTYSFLEKYSTFLYTPQKEDSCLYVKHRSTFLTKTDLDSSNLPKIVSYYDPKSIKSNLANLRMLLIEVTDKCNLSCKYCGYGELYSNYDKRETKTQDFNTIKSLIDYLADLWRSSLNISFNNNITIGFYGGEPLLGIDIIKQTITYLENLEIKNITFSYNMTTNALLLDKYMDFLVEKKFRLLLSLDGDENNNSYRLTQSKKSSFPKIVKNIILLKNKYPSYFNENVGFNSVLHNRNSVEEIFEYITKTFDKHPGIAELNSNGVLKEKEEEFWKMFKNKFQSLRDAENCESLTNDFFSIDPLIVNLDRFINAYTSNTYNSYTDLFIDEAKQNFIPTGTCEPFKRKLYLTVNGKILPCEKIGHKNPLGFIKGNIVDINYKQISNFYASLYEKIIPYCKECLLWKSCTLCIYHMPNQKGKLKCDRFLPRHKSYNHFAYYMSYMEEHPTYYKRIINEIDNY